MSRKNSGRFIDILTDFGWKFYFGREENKIFLIAFLNCLLVGEHVIVDLQLTNVEESGEHPEERKIIFDLRCIGDKGEIFLIELQLRNQAFFIDRAVTYTSRTISRSAKRGTEGNSYELPPVYFIGVLGFPLDPDDSEKYYYSGKIMDELDHKVLYHKLTYKFLVLPNFNKSGAELTTLLDQWMYLMKNMHAMDKLSHYLDKRIFSRIFEIGEVANLTPEDRMGFLTEADRERDQRNILAYAKQQAMEEGEKKGRAEERAKAEKRIQAEQAKVEVEKRAMALEMRKLGLDAESVARISGLSVAEVNALK